MTTAFVNPFSSSVGGAFGMGDKGGSSSPPPAPDYSNAAQATQRSQMIDQYSPYGSMTYSSSAGSPSGYASTVNLSPAGWDLLQKQQQASGYYGDQAVKGLQRVGESFSKPFDYGSVQNVQDASYGAQTARLDPQWAQNSAAKETELRNQGIPVGSEAWDNEMRVFNQAKNDAYSQARQAAISTAPQTFQLASALRDQPLNEVNALRTGSQVTTPQFTPAGQQPQANQLAATTAGGQYQGNLYNQQIAQQNAMMNGLFSLGSAAVLA